MERASWKPAFATTRPMIATARNGRSVFVFWNVIRFSQTAEAASIKYHATKMKGTVSHPNRSPTFIVTCLADSPKTKGRM